MDLGFDGIGGPRRALRAGPDGLRRGSGPRPVHPRRHRLLRQLHRRAFGRRQRRLRRRGRGDLFAGFSLTGFYESATVNGVRRRRHRQRRDVDAGYTCSTATTTPSSAWHQARRRRRQRPDQRPEHRAGYERWGDYSRTLIYANADYALRRLDRHAHPVRRLPQRRGHRRAHATTARSSRARASRTQALDIFLQAQPAGRGQLPQHQLQRRPSPDRAPVERRPEPRRVPPALQRAVGQGRLLDRHEHHQTTTPSAWRRRHRHLGRPLRPRHQQRLTETVFGYEVTWNYYDLRFAYGNYDQHRGGPGSLRPRRSRSSTPSPSELAQKHGTQGARAPSSDGARAFVWVPGPRPAAAYGAMTRSAPGAARPRNGRGQQVRPRRATGMGVDQVSVARVAAKRWTEGGRGGAAHDPRQDAQVPRRPKAPATTTSRRRRRRGAGAKHEAATGAGTVLHATSSAGPRSDAAAGSVVISTRARRQAEVAHGAQDAVEVAREATEGRRRLQDAARDVGVEARPEGVDERFAVDLADVDSAARDRRGGSRRRRRVVERIQAERVREVVAGPAGSTPRRRSCARQAGAARGRCRRRPRRRRWSRPAARGRGARVAGRLGDVDVTSCAGGLAGRRRSRRGGGGRARGRRSGSR
jgi:hypothetical protein